MHRSTCFGSQFTTISPYRTTNTHSTSQPILSFAFKHFPKSTKHFIFDINERHWNPSPNMYATHLYRFPFQERLFCGSLFTMPTKGQQRSCRMRWNRVKGARKMRKIKQIRKIQNECKQVKSSECKIKNTYTNTQWLWLCFNSLWNRFKRFLVFANSNS